MAFSEDYNSKYWILSISSYLCQCNYHTVPTSQSEATVTQSGDNQSRGDDETSRVESYGM